MDTRYEEFRIILSARVDAPPGRQEWGVTLWTRKDGPLRDLKGNKDFSSPKLTVAELSRLRDPNGWPQGDFLNNVGRKVWESIMTPQLDIDFMQAYQRMLGVHDGLRIVVQILDSDEPAVPGDAVRLADLPVELLLRTDSGAIAPFVATDEHAPVSRGLPPSTNPTAFELDGPLRILALVAAPDDMPPLDADKEVAALKEALKDPIQKELVVLDFCEPTFDALNERLGKETWHVLHFVGHGGMESFGTSAEEAYLAFILPESLNQPRKLVKKITAGDLGTGLARASALKLIVLTACSSAAAPAARRGLDSVAYKLLGNSVDIAAVVAMQYDLESAAASPFARSFYKDLLDQIGLDLAVTRARKAIVGTHGFNSGHRAWAAPILLWRSPPDGQLFRRTCGRLDPSQERDLATAITSFSRRRPILEDMYADLRSVSPEVRQSPGLRNLLRQSEDEVIGYLDARAALLRGTVRLAPTRAVAGGQPVRVRLTLRPCRDAKIRSLNFSFQYDSTVLSFQKWHPAADVEAGAITTAVSDGAVLKFFYIHKQASGPPATWAAAQEKILGEFEFAVAPARLAGLLDLPILNDLQVDGDGVENVIGIDGLVLITFADA